MKIPVYDKNGELEGFVEPISETAADSAKVLGIICGFLLIGAVLVWLVNYSQLKQRASKSATSSRTLFFFDASLGAAD